MTILHVDPGAPEWIRDTATAVLYLHIGGGIVGVISGYTAILAHKGETLHRAAGNVFFAAMLVMSGIGAAVAPLIRHPGSMVGGLITFYLVATAWATVKRGEGRIGRFERVAFAGALGIIALGIALLLAAGPRGTLGDEPMAPLYPFLFVVVIAAVSDFRMILRGGITGAARIARHLWRMCFAFFVASASFFLGQQKMLPAALHGPWLFVPALAPLVFLVYWLIRVRWTGRKQALQGAH